MPAARVKKRLTKRRAAKKPPLGWRLHGRGGFFARSRVGQFTIVPEGSSFMLTLETKDGHWEDLGSSGSAKTLMGIAERRARRSS